MTGIPPAPRGDPQVEVGFDGIDANEHPQRVRPKDLGTGKEQKIEIKAGSGLSDAEIKNMVAAIAETHADDDRWPHARRLAGGAQQRRERRPTRRPSASSKELGDAVDDEPRATEQIEAAIKAVREVLDGRRSGGDPLTRTDTLKHGVPPRLGGDLRACATGAGQRWRQRSERR